ncbi:MULTISPECIES: hypothetical protein [Cohaesibacter]|uniref:hypothetical protein n=1 Tax=Cohaesibacter TaxID=655352 RepID=UPI000DE96809|nr:MULTISPECIES: hypothetical protein [Cohaesibacter]TLP49005.1 hypothetical protein FDK21_05025 [Cohaesibacter sp. CAU 1516]
MVMTPFIAGSLGALIGLLTAVLANLLVLPAVLRAQDDGFIMGRRTTLDAKKQAQVADFTRFMYRIPMPVLFTLVGFVAGQRFFGG